MSRPGECGIPGLLLSAHQKRGQSEQAARLGRFSLQVERRLKRLQQIVEPFRAIEIGRSIPSQTDADEIQIKMIFMPVPRACHRVDTSRP